MIENPPKDINLNSLGIIVSDKNKYYSGSSKDDLPGEIWKIGTMDVKIKVSNFGRIEKNKKRSIGNIRDNKEYITAIIKKDKKDYQTFIHRLVLDAFIGKSNLQVNHKNGNKDDNRLENLEYVTGSQNMLHVHSYLSDKTRKSVVRIDKDGNIVASFKSGRDADRHFGYRKQKVMDAIRRNTNIDGYFWKYENEKDKKKDIRENPNNKLLRSVYRIEEDGSIKYRFENAKDADKYFGYSLGKISTIIRKNLKIEGYVWKRDNNLFI